MPRSPRLFEVCCLFFVLLSSVSTQAQAPNAQQTGSDSRGAAKVQGTLGAYSQGDPKTLADGVRISAIDQGGPADQAGVHQGDYITSLDGHFVTSAEQLSLLVRNCVPGTRVRITYRRNSSIYDTYTNIGSERVPRTTGTHAPETEPAAQSSAHPATSNLKSMPHSTAEAPAGMTNEDIVNMVQAGLSDETISLSIHSKPHNFDLSADGIVKLKRAGISDPLLAAMLGGNSGEASHTQPTRITEQLVSVPPEEDDQPTMSAASSSRGQSQALDTSGAQRRLTKKLQAVSLTAPTLNENDITDAIGEGAKLKGRFGCFRLRDTTRWNSQHHTGFVLGICTPKGWIREQASEASEKFIVIDRKQIADSIIQPFLRLVIWPDIPDRVNAAGSDVKHVVVRSEDKGQVLQPLATDTFTMETHNGFGGRADHIGLVAVFSQADVERIRDLSSKREFFVTVVGTASDKDFKVKEKFFDHLD